MSDITWQNETRKLSDLVPWEYNPKQLTEAQGESLRVSLDKFGLALPLLIDDENNIYDGHQRQQLMAGMTQYGANSVIDVRVSSRPLTWDEQRELVIRLRENQAGWDFDALGNIYDVEELQEWGFPEWRISGLTQPDDDEWGDAFGALPDGDRAPFQQMTFTLHDEQVEMVKRAITVAKSLGEFGDTGNENSNGNALARICEMFEGEHGQG